jgi:hypothetical protein
MKLNKKLNVAKKDYMTEADKKRVEETLYALTDDEAVYLRRYLKEAKRFSRYRGGKKSALEGYQELSGLINP